MLNHSGVVTRKRSVATPSQLFSGNRRFLHLPVFIYFFAHAMNASAVTQTRRMGSFASVLKGCSFAHARRKPLPTSNRCILPSVVRPFPATAPHRCTKSIRIPYSKPRQESRRFVSHSLSARPPVSPLFFHISTKNCVRGVLPADAFFYSFFSRRFPSYPPSRQRPASS